MRKRTIGKKGRYWQKWRPPPQVAVRHRLFAGPKGEWRAGPFLPETTGLPRKGWSPETGRGTKTDSASCRMRKGGGRREASTGATECPETGEEERGRRPRMEDSGRFPQHLLSSPVCSPGSRTCSWPASPRCPAAPRSAGRRGGGSPSLRRQAGQVSGGEGELPATK